MSFTDRLDQLMEERRINRSTLSREANIPYTTIDGFYKKGSDNIKLSTLRKLTDYFDCSLDFLVENETRNRSYLHTYQKGSAAMLSQKKPVEYTSEDYWNLPDGERAELIDGELYAMAPPNRIHQKLIFQLSKCIGLFIDTHNGNCELYPAPFAVNLDAEDQSWVEPDISVICDKDKLTDRGCSGAPDLILEIVSPSSRRMDYFTKNALYAENNVREYWIVDPVKERVAVYHYEEDDTPVIYSFDQDIPVKIFDDLTINIGELLR